MLPAERGEVSEQLVRNILGLAQSGNGAIEVPRVPQDDCGDEEVQARGVPSNAEFDRASDISAATNEGVEVGFEIEDFSSDLYRRRSFPL